MKSWKHWDFTKCPRSTIESNQGQCLKSRKISKETFYVFRRIESENSWKWNKFNLRLPCIYLFQVSPFHCHKTQRTSLSFWISRIYLVTQTTFSDSWVPLTFFPAATLVVYHIRIKMREKINVLTQHSVKANTKPLSERQSLSESCGGSHQT